MSGGYPGSESADSTGKQWGYRGGFNLRIVRIEPTRMGVNMWDFMIQPTSKDRDSADQANYSRK